MAKTYPVLPLRDIVVFPHMIVPLFVGRERSVRALEKVMEASREIFLVTQRDAADDEPAPEQLYGVGIVANVLQLLKLPDGTVKVLVEGGYRAATRNLRDNGDFLEAEPERIRDVDADAAQQDALVRAAVEQFESYGKLNKKVSPEVASKLSDMSDASQLADSIAAHLAVKIADKQALLEEPRRRSANTI